MNNIQTIILTAIAGLVLSFTSCMNDDFTSDPSKNVTITTDTIDYNTVFTTIQQPTKVLKIYNKNKDAITISSIRISGGEDSPFKMTVNGQKGQLFNNIDIFSKDSIYVFIDMNLSSNGTNTSVMLTDSLLIQCNGIEKKVILTGCGQDAIILKDDTIKTKEAVFTSEKPYLIFGNLVVSQGAKLTIEPGTTMYFHNGAGMKINGTLSAKGTAEKFIIMRGDRTDNIFENVPYDSISNQWNGIEFASTSTNELEYVEMRSGKHAVDLWNDTINQKININNCIIRNFGGYGIAAKNSEVTINNSIIANSGINSIRICGGKLSSTHCSIASYSRKRSSAAIRIENSDNDVATNVTADLKNCIVAGSYAAEITLNDYYKSNETTENFNVTFTSCLLQIEDTSKSYFKNCLFAKYGDKIFTDTDKYPYDYSINETSAALDAADPSIASLFPKDLFGQDRLTDSKPDIGAIEKIK